MIKCERNFIDLDTKTLTIFISMFTVLPYKPRFHIILKLDIEYEFAGDFVTTRCNLIGLGKTVRTTAVQNSDSKQYNLICTVCYFLWNRTPANMLVAEVYDAFNTSEYPQCICILANKGILLVLKLSWFELINNFNLRSFNHRSTANMVVHMKRLTLK